jgi:hypothetical protein
MRITVAAGVFGMAVLAAACGGGGKSVIPPAGTIATNASPTPAAKSKRSMAIVLNIPPASKQSNARKPFYVSPNTQSIAVAVVPNGSGTPTPQELQVFPVATPSPCAVNPTTGAESCTFDVVAPFGTDIFYVATFNVASPNPNTTPLASFVSGAIVIASAAPAPTPLAFTMNGIVNSVVVTVPSPDPNNTPNTQVFTVEVPTSQPLGITPYDVSGSPILSDTFLVPIGLNVAPASDGVTLAIASTCSSGSGGSGAGVTVGCAADLSNVKVVYDGSVHPDSNDHIIDTFAIAAAQNPSPSPSPAIVVLQGNEQTYTPNEGGASYSATYLQALSGNVVAYMLAGNGDTTASYGTINVSTGALSTPVTLNNTYPLGFFEMSGDGSIWVADALNDDILCYTAGSSTPTTTVPLSPIVPDDVSFDGTKIWWTASSVTPQNYAYSANLTGTCTIGTPTQYALPTLYQDPTLLISPFAAGGIAIDGVADGDFYTVTSSGTFTTLNPGFTGGSGFGGGIAADGTGVTYAAFNNTTNGYVMSLASITATPAQLVTFGNVHFGGLAAFGPNGTAADRIAYANTTYDTLDIIEGPNGASPIIVPATIGYVSFLNGHNVAISTNGATLAGFYSQALTPGIARPLFTTTWSVPVTQLAFDDVLGIYERGDSGPFTVTPVGTPPSCFYAISPVTGTDHAFFVETNYITGSCTVTLQITDKNGRSQSVTVQAPENAG